ncbi:MAG TPA: helix-turn-helix transcriptional regulator, partial [Bacillota bacterium]|nr:helix-turn-helix transcriptional regulator [Bacillota bacterium]
QLKGHLLPQRRCGSTRPTEALEIRMRIWGNRLTQRQVADAVGITEQAMSEYLLGRRLLKRQELEAIEAYLTEMEEAVCEG